MNLESYNFNTLLVEKSEYGLNIKINRPDHQNSLSKTLITELGQLLDIAEKMPECKLIVIKGHKGIFCAGMDFEEFLAADSSFDANKLKSLASQYMNLIKRFTLIPKIIISSVEGQAIGGGIGLVAASDFVIATPQAQFCLPEALWGLIPAMLIPYLIRRVGVRKANLMTLTTLPYSSKDALEMNLVDEINDSPENSINRLWLRLRRIDESTIGGIKNYFRKMWIITEQVEAMAVDEISRLMADQKVRQNIENFVKFRKVPGGL